jgi:ABC-2 type transport system permease protein
MRNIWVICQKELHSYFVSPIAYVLLTMFSLIFGYVFWNEVRIFNLESLQAQMSGQAPPMNVNEMLIRPVLSNGLIGFIIVVLIVPLITMRLFAEEKRTGTIELLATSPIRDIEIILGKWLAALALYATLLLFTALNFGFLFKYGNPDWRPLAVGTFISALTRNQIIAAVGTIGVFLLLWILEWPSGYETATWAQVMAYCSVNKHYESFTKGVLDSKDAIYYISLIFLGLFLTSRSMESLRWRS